jgi:predicted acylesterase/phospholipase RssA
VFRPHRLWRLPLLGTHDYVLPRTIAERIEPIEELAAGLAGAERELVVCATDVTEGQENGHHDYELVYSSRTTPAGELAQAILASAAISTLVLPLRVGDRIATDGSWARNYPLAHAYKRPDVHAIVAFRYVPCYPKVDAAAISRLRRRLERFGRVPPVRAFLAELREAEAREARGEPPHLVDMIRRLMRVAVVRNSVLEERHADEIDRSIHELELLRTDLCRLVQREVRDGHERAQLLEAIDARFASARFPFRHERELPRITVRGEVADVSLESGPRDDRRWSDEDKRALLQRGWELADAELAAHGIKGAEPVPA